MPLSKVAENIVKNTSKKVLVSQVEAMLTHFQTYNFLFKDERNILHLDFNCENIRQSIKNEWMLSNSTLNDHPTFCFGSLEEKTAFKRAFVTVRNLATVLPFGLVEVVKNCHKPKYQPLNDSVESIKNQFENADETILRNHAFCLPQNATEFFYKLQRERKIWWRKFSALPSRFYTSEICADEQNKRQFVEIKAEFPWGAETVEIINYQPEGLSEDRDFFEIRHLRKKYLPQMVTCQTSVERATLTYLCDSFEKLNEDGVGEMLRLSKKLAPYKVAFVVPKSPVSAVQNLNELAWFLAKKIRKCGITVLMLPDSNMMSHESQFARNDALGIPYTILLNEQTLRDGIISLRNRDTTLKEQSHVSLIVPYIEKIIKSG